MRKWIVLLALLCTSLASAAVVGWRNDVPNALLVGRGDYRVLGLQIYSAELWSTRLPFNQDMAFALQITYSRKISRQQLVDISLDEMRRLHGEPLGADRDRWVRALQQAFQDVQPGDQLTGLYRPDKGVRFYFGDRLTAEIPDADFGKAFFAIWLHPATNAPRLRERLIGKTT